MSRAIAKASHATTTDCTAPTVDASALTTYPGHGLEGQIGGERYRIGTESFVGQLVGRPLDTPPATVDLRSQVLLGRAGEWLAWIELEDPLRSDAGETVCRLQGLGITVHLVSGDAPGAVNAAARSLGVSETHVRAQATPRRKLDYLATLQDAGRTVGMVGDGINDAPVLARADVSVAMGTGTDLARADADAVLLTTRLTPLADAVQVARSMRRIVVQNLVWAIGYNATAVPMAMSGLISPWIAALGMSASSLLVIANAARLHPPSRPVSAAFPRGD